MARINDILTTRYVVYSWCDGKFDAHNPGWERGPSYANEVMAQQQAAHYEAQGQRSYYVVEVVE